MAGQAAPQTGLRGKRVVITRAEAQSGKLVALLEAAGASVVEFPTIEIQPPSDWGPLDSAVDRLNEYDWWIFTSANGVRSFLERAERRGVRPAAVQKRVCAIGPATKRALEEAGIKVHLLPAEYVAESLVSAFEAEKLSGTRILLPRAAVARDVVPSELEKRGATVDVVEAYRTVLPQDARERAPAIFKAESRPDWITFTSSSTVSNFVKAAGAAALRDVRVASIGPVTSRTAQSHGIHVDAEARVFTIEGLFEAILEAERLGT
jgi:uroporphyrinogen III methyltransferase / synthase